jgi:thioredoxin 1
MTLKDKLSIAVFLLLVLMFTKCEAQEFVSSDDFNNVVAKDIVVIEFYADWNSVNAAKYELNDCSYYMVDISKSMGLQSEFGITAIPTLIIFENGEEKSRFVPNVMFQLEADSKTVQKNIDKLMLAKFN